MIFKILLCFNLWLQAVNQKLVIDTQIESQSYQKIGNEDKEFTIWVRFQIQFIEFSDLQIPFAYINEVTPEKQIIMSYKYSDQLEMLISIPQLNYTNTIFSINNSDINTKQWIHIYLQKEGQFISIQTNNQTATLPQIQMKTDVYDGSFITWQNATFSLKAYMGVQESLEFEQFYLLNYDLFGIAQQTIMNYREKIEIDMYIRQIYNKTSLILELMDKNFDYFINYDNYSAIINATTNLLLFEFKQFQDISPMEWFKLRIYIQDYKSTIFQITTKQNLQEWVYSNMLYKQIDYQDFGLYIKFNNKFTQFQNIIISNRLNYQQDDCFPECKKSQCLECQTTDNLSNLLRCGANQFYDSSLQRCFDISNYFGIVENPQQITICKLYEYYNYREQMCLKCPRLEEYYCTDCVYNTNQWIINSTCTFQEINSLMLLQQIASRVDLIRNQLFLQFDSNLTRAINEKCVLTYLQGLIFCERQFYQQRQFCSPGIDKFFAKKCNVTRGYFYKSKSIMCQLGYTQIFFKCLKCPSNCVICIYEHKQIKCLISKEGHYIINKTFIIRKCNNNPNCSILLQEPNKGPEEKCLFYHNKRCLFCEEFYVLDYSFKCVSGERLSLIHNIQFFAQDFQQISLQQLAQLQNQDQKLSESIFWQIQFYSNQYQNIRIDKEGYIQNYDSPCNKYIIFNQTKKCVNYLDDQQYMQEEQTFYYCPHGKCGQNLTLNIDVYFTNIQIIKHQNKSYLSIQEMLDNQIVQLYLQEMKIIAQVYVFESFKQDCQDSQIFILNDKSLKEFYKYTFFKLILIFQNKSQFPNCATSYLQSNIKSIEIRNLFTNSKLTIRIQSRIARFINCKFEDLQSIFVIAQYILFEEVQILDSVIQNKTLIALLHKGFFLQEIKFTNCQFINLKLSLDSIIIQIYNFPKWIVIKNFTLLWVQINNSKLVQIEKVGEFYAEGWIFQNIISSASVFMYEQYDSPRINKFKDIKIQNSMFLDSRFFFGYGQILVKHFQIIYCTVNSTSIFAIFNHAYLVDLEFRFVIVKTSILIYVKNSASTITLESIKIVDSQFYVINTNYVPFIFDCFQINMTNFIFANSKYQPPINIFRFKSQIVRISFMDIYNITLYSSPIDVQQQSILSFDAREFQIYQLQFTVIELSHQKLLFINSDLIKISNLKVQQIKLSRGPFNEIIEFSLIGKQSILNLVNFLITNLVVQQDQISSLISIKGNKGKQFIRQIVINNVRSQTTCYIFNLIKNNLELRDIKGNFHAHVGFIIQFESILYVIDYTHYSQSDSLESWDSEIFSNISPTSNYESLSISDSLFNHILQPLVKIIHNKIGNLTLQNVQILNYQGIKNIIDLRFQNLSSQSQDVNTSFSIKMDKVLIQNTSKNLEKIIYCQFVDIRLSQIYLLNTNSIILWQQGGKSTLIINLQSQNSSLTDISLFIFQDIQNQLFIRNVFLKNLDGSQNIFKIAQQRHYNQLFLIQYIFIDLCKNCFNFFTFENFYTIKQFYINNLYIRSSNFKSYLINIYNDQESQLYMNNLLIINSILSQLANHQQQKLLFHFGQLSMIDIKFTNSISSEKVTLTNSYLSNCSFDGYLISLINKSLVLNNHQQILEQPLVISFNKNKFLKSELVEQSLYKVMFSIESKYAYVPTGVPFSQFVYLNQITQEYEKPYDDFVIIINYFSDEQILCTLNQSVDEQQGNFSNLNQFYLKNGLNIIEGFQFIMNPYLNYTYIQNDIHCKNDTLRFNVRALPCQLGEYLYQNKCLTCDISKNYYSVVKKALMCDIMDIQKIQQLKVGKIMLRTGFWRAKQYSNKIELCDNELCQGGWAPGDASCSDGHVGALCKECDIYDIRGQGRFAQFDDGCLLCDFNSKVILKGVFISFWLMLMGFMSYNTNNQITRQYLFYKITKRNLADILMRQSTNQVSIIIKIFANYVFYIYLLKDELDFINYQFHIQLDFISNPTLLVKPQLDCLLVQYHQVGVHYLQLVFSIISPFYTLTLLYLVFLILFKLKVIQFQFNLIIITIYSVYLFNQQIIFQQQIQLLSYKTVSNIDWINLNWQFEFNTHKHHHMMYFYIIPSTILFIILPICIFQFLRNMNRTSIKSTKYFGILFTEYKRDYYYWEIVRTYQKYVIMMSIYFMNENCVLYIIQIYLALNIFIQPYPLKNLNYLEQKSFYILISSFLNILYITTENSKIFQIYFFIIFNFILLYDLLVNLIQKLKLQNKDILLKMQQILIQRYPVTIKLFNLQKQAKLKYNIDILRKNSLKSRPNKQNRNINLGKIQLHENFQRLETEIEMMDIQK